jgi:hypothetical protein
MARRIEVHFYFMSERIEFLIDSIPAGAVPASPARRRYGGCGEVWGSDSKLLRGVT